MCLELSKKEHYIEFAIWITELNYQKKKTNTHPNNIGKWWSDNDDNDYLTDDELLDVFFAYLTNKSEITYKEILTDIKNIITLERKYDDEYYPSIIGMKRLIFGLWHNGENELGDNMIMWMEYDVKKLYVSLIDKYKHYKEPIIRF